MPRLTITELELCVYREECTVHWNLLLLFLFFYIRAAKKKVPQCLIVFSCSRSLTKIVSIGRFSEAGLLE